MKSSREMIKGKWRKGESRLPTLVQGVEIISFCDFLLYKFASTTGDEDIYSYD
jgi:hypothetical protein